MSTNTCILIACHTPALPALLLWKVLIIGTPCRSKIGPDKPPPPAALRFGFRTLHRILGTRLASLSCLPLLYSSCYSPECRSPSTVATQSRTIQSIVDLLLKHRPELQRTEAERRQADERWQPVPEIKARTTVLVGLLG